MNENEKDEDQSNLAKKLYNWKASTKLNIGLKETINYYNTFEL